MKVSDALATRGVQARLTLDPQARTGAMLVVHGTDERSMVADRGANGRLRDTDLPDDMSAEAVLVSGYLLYDEGSEAAALAALQRARAPLIAVEASSWPLLEAYGPARFLEGSSCATLLLANEREAAVLFGSAEAEGTAAVTAGSRPSRMPSKRTHSSADVQSGTSATRSSGRESSFRMSSVYW